MKHETGTCKELRGVTQRIASTQRQCSEGRRANPAIDTSGHSRVLSRQPSCSRTEEGGYTQGKGASPQPKPPEEKPSPKCLLSAGWRLGGRDSSLGWGHTHLQQPKDGAHCARGKQRQTGRQVPRGAVSGQAVTLRSGPRGQLVVAVTSSTSASRLPLSTHRTGTPRVRIRAAGQGLLSWVPSDNPPPRPQPLPPPHLLRVPPGEARLLGRHRALRSTPVSSCRTGLGTRPPASLTHLSSRLCHTC